MTKDKSLHLTPKQLGLEDNPMIKDADPLASDKGGSYPTFDEAAFKFMNDMYRASHWKENYFGAAYSTRIEQAIRDARASCDEMEKAIARDDAR